MPFVFYSFYVRSLWYIVINSYHIIYPTSLVAVLGQLCRHLLHPSTSGSVAPADIMGRIIAHIMGWITAHAFLGHSSILR